VSLGVGGAGLVAWAVAGGLAIAKKNDLSSECQATCPLSASDDRNAYEAMREASTVGFVVGLVGAGAGATLLLSAPRGARTSTGTLTPWIGPQGAGISGRF